MWKLKARLRPAIIIHFLIHFVFFFIVSWIIFSLLLGYEPLTVIAVGFLTTILSLIIEVIFAPNWILKQLDPRWLDQTNDPLLYTLIQSEADKIGIKYSKLGIIDVEPPNAIVIGSFTSGPIILITKGLSQKLSYREMRVVASYLFGVSKSGFLLATTMFAGVLTLSFRLAERYILNKISLTKERLVDKIFAFLGFIPFILTVPQYVRASNPASNWGDRYALHQSDDPSAFITALLKISHGIAVNYSNINRTKFIPIKGIMFMDPTIALRDHNNLLDASMSLGVKYETSTTVGSKEGKSARLEYHMFEQFWCQSSSVERFRWAIGIGKKMDNPLKIGLSWIE
jgi:Zn-dependent protease with chaperone function